jgi:hypothetical protein
VTARSALQPVAPALWRPEYLSSGLAASREDALPAVPGSNCLAKDVEMLVGIAGLALERRHAVGLEQCLPGPFGGALLEDAGAHLAGVGEGFPLREGEGAEGGATDV